MPKTPGGKQILDAWWLHAVRVACFFCVFFLLCVFVERGALQGPFCCGVQAVPAN